MALTVVITGASRGIGKALAQHFAAAGYELLLSARNADGVEATVKALREQFPSIAIHGKAADLSVAEQAIELGRWCLSFSAPDIIINNAGFFQPGSLADEPMGQLENQIQVNLGSAYHLTRTLLPSMLQRGTGHIFNICSIASLDAYEHGGAYSISKFALLGFSKNLRLELKDKLTFFVFFSVMKVLFIRLLLREPLTIVSWIVSCYENELFLLLFDMIES